MFKKNIRVIARLDIKGPNLIKGIHLEGLRVIGNPQVYAQNYYQQGIDELLCIDSVASLYGRNNLSPIVSKIAENVFIPITVGGGVRSVENVRDLLKSGADKVAINTAVIKRPSLITEISETFGAQCMVLSVEAKRVKNGWEAYMDNGREKTGKCVIQWIQKAIKLGAGEILVTSVDREGTRKGYDVELMSVINKNVSVPVIASGGMGALDHLDDLIHKSNVDAIAIADVFHNRRLELSKIKSHLNMLGAGVRV